jgi:hypothetical protein
MPAMDLSHSRHPLQRHPQASLDAEPRYCLAETVGEAAAAVRAGRPASCRGVLVRRSPAMTAGRTVLSGWSLAMGGPCRTAVGCAGPRTGDTLTSVGKELPERFPAFTASTLFPTGTRGDKRRTRGSAWCRPQSMGSSRLRRGNS